MRSRGAKGCVGLELSAAMVQSAEAFEQQLAQGPSPPPYPIRYIQARCAAPPLLSLLGRRPAINAAFREPQQTSHHHPPLRCSPT
jgi:hypothetical protein